MYPLMDASYFNHWLSFLHLEFASALFIHLFWTELGQWLVLVLMMKQTCIALVSRELHFPSYMYNLDVNV